jgi:hypothetical protein
LIRHLSACHFWGRLTLHQMIATKISSFYTQLLARYFVQCVGHLND